MHVAMTAGQQRRDLRRWPASNRNVTGQRGLPACMHSRLARAARLLPCGGPHYGSFFQKEVQTGEGRPSQSDRIEIVADLRSHQRRHHTRG